jgi:hypothetical protein
MLLVAAADVHSQTGGWRTDDRVLVTDFGIVTSLARSPQSVFAATSGGLLVVDEAFQRSELPITVEDGYPTLPTTALAFDHRDGTVWIAAGDLLQFDPFSRRFRDRVPVPRVVTEIVPAESSGDDLFVRLGAEWWRLDSFSRDLRRADPGAVRAAIDARSDLRARDEALRDPFFLDAAAQAVRSPHTGPVRIFDVTPAREAYGWWLATAGQSLVRYDGIGRVGERAAIGPAGTGMAAVLADDGVVFFAPQLPLEGRYGVAAASDDLQQWRVWRADSSRAVPDLVRDLLRSPGGRWAGGESGLYWIGDGDSEWAQARSVGLSHVPVLSLSNASGPTPEAVWVGTARGLLRVVAAGGSIDISVMESSAVLATVESAGSVWVGTAQGLFSMPVADSVVPSARPQRVAGPSALRNPVGALAASGDTVYAGLDREVWWSVGGDGWSRLESVGRARAPVSALVVRDRTLWVGTAGGLTVVDVGRGPLGRYSFGPDLPPGRRGETGISDIAVVSDTEAWVATPAGALRMHVRH